ncbi:MAG: D-alanyl-D-alanine carboxypeptidase [Defluviitaleaceae bacterium]|nr:D-alanyl-D-alanine carboxypeptidase [Defluviitaleaceae bacterium]
MKKIILIFAFIFIFSMTIFADEAKINEPNVNAHGAILMDFNTGRVLWEKNSKTPLAMASTTKIMTAIVALEMANLEDVVKVSRKAAVSPQVKMSLSENEEIKLEYLLYALMLQSYNDSAVAIAEHISGSVEEFCRLMTEKAKELGATDTIFETPSGLDLGEHQSTAYDMAIITRYALKNEKFMKIINTPNITVSSNKRTYNLVNKNRLLNEFDGANGVKTGFTGKAGHCFVGSAKRNDMQLISVVLASGWGNMGKEQKWRDTKEILSYGFNAYEYHDIIDMGDIAGSIEIERSKTAQIELMYSEDFFLPLNKQELENLSVEAYFPEILRAPVTKGDTLGSVRVFIDGNTVKEIDLIATDSAERHDLKTSLEKVLTNWISQATNKEANVILPEF